MREYGINKGCLPSQTLLFVLYWFSHQRGSTSNFSGGISLGI